MPKLKKTSKNVNPLWEALKKFKNGEHTRIKYHYFLWKNKIFYSYRGEENYDISEEEFIKKFLDGSRVKYRNLERWSESEEYQKLLLLYKKQNLIKDLISVYDAILEKSLNGDNAAVKTLISLQQEIDRLYKEISDEKPKQEEEEQEDDGLIIE
jgi:hypothetical protein